MGISAGDELWVARYILEVIETIYLCVCVYGDVNLIGKRLMRGIYGTLLLLTEDYRDSWCSPFF